MSHGVETPTGRVWPDGERNPQGVWLLRRLDWHPLGAPPALEQLLTTALQAFFAGRPWTEETPALRLDPQGTLFQMRVWQTLLTIPYGQTTTYGELAHRLETAPRAVGGAVAANPLPLLIPCHRVVGVNGLGGYSGQGGLVSKQRLLDWEAGNG
ncbi:MAG: methylated-DNA--[protein]-cysteine S-methyltransferase [Magnetococcales bacterium]|nr:methylated-DNA--[protein]-cysteine S-methyltransferase [Magnetococcales bacterium]